MMDPDLRTIGQSILRSHPNSVPRGADLPPCIRIEENSMHTHKILFIGSQCLGSNARGLAYAFRRLGHVVQMIDEDVYFPPARSLPGRLGRRLLNRFHLKEYSFDILSEDSVLEPDFVLVYKGNAVTPQTLATLKRRGRPVVLVYPDVSMTTHGRLIPNCIPLYDYIFTTKTFGLSDLRRLFGVTNAEFMPHGFDPDLHRPLQIPDTLRRGFCCDATFIGTWSPHKEQLLSQVMKQLPDLRLSIWGNQWAKSTNSVLTPVIRNKPALGDLYPIALRASKISIAILSECRPGASSGDQITSRSFNIPASGGFMLHERTDEILQYYIEGREIACFSNGQELAEKIEYYIGHEDEREQIRLAGYTRCCAENSLDRRAEKIISVFENRILRVHPCS